eukprot:PhM_4_TR18274/c0_g1_i1/m.20168/K09539/DNAJC19; DnaJ homolog subfamily C member 19
MVWPIILGVGLLVGYQAVRVAPQVMARYNAAAAAARGALPYRHYEHGFLKSMTVEEARLVLGLQQGYTAEQLKQRHRDLVTRFHTDVGGSPVLSQKVNEAREILEGKRQ